MKISIVTPSLNQADYLEDTISSVLGQEYENLEYVIIDGGSVDGSVEILEKYKDSLKFVVSEPDMGHADALNKGFSHTSGEIMAWINSDDMYLPWTFRAVAEIFSEFPDINWIVGINSVWNDKGMMISAGNRKPINLYDYLIGDYSWIQQESVFWRRSLWDKAGGYIDADYKYMVDGELWSRFFLHNRLYMVDCLLGGYRVHTENRAAKFHQECHDEMREIIRSMRRRADASHLLTAKLLKFVRLFSGKVFRFFRIDLVVMLLFYRVLRKCKYDIVRYVNGEWKTCKRTLLKIRI